MAKLINTYILEFFNQYLKGIPSSSLHKCQSISDDTMLMCGKNDGINKSGSDANITAIGIAGGVAAAALVGATYLESN